MGESYVGVDWKIPAVPGVRYPQHDDYGQGEKCLRGHWVKLRRVSTGIHTPRNIWTQGLSAHGAISGAIIDLH